MNVAIPKTIEKTAEKYGLLIAAGLTLFFLIMKWSGLAHVIELRALNFFILAGGIYLSLKEFKRANGSSFTYLKGLGLGVLTSIIGCVGFGLIIFIYVQFIDPAFMQALIENEAMGRFLNPYIVAVAVAVEGIGSGMILAFILMNYMDTQH
ncbi:MAG: DUF4199 domain-containing protein [Bacteroidota bacterium]